MKSKHDDGTHLQEVDSQRYGALPQEDALDVEVTDCDHISERPLAFKSLLTVERIGLCASYALVGFVPSFLATPSTVYLIRSQNASPVQQNAIGAAAVCHSCPNAVVITVVAAELTTEFCMTDAALVLQNHIRDDLR